MTSSTMTRRRSGAVLVCVMVCLLVVTGLLASMMQAALRTQRQLRVEQTSRQVDFLLEAGLSRAAYQFAQNPDYAGETWRPSAEPSDLDRLAEVTISLLDDKDPTSSVVQVVAEYPVGSVHSIRRTSSFPVTHSTLIE